MQNLMGLLFFASLILLIIGLIKPSKSIFWDKQKASRKKTTLIYGFLTLLFLGLIGATAPESKEKINSEPEKVAQEQKEKSDISDEIKQMSAGEQLALLDAGHRISKDDITVIRMNTLLERLSSRYNEPIDSIADVTSKVQGVIHDQGVNDTNLNILENVWDMGKMDNSSYQSVAMLYALAKSN